MPCALHGGCGGLLQLWRWLRGVGRLVVNALLAGVALDWLRPALLALGLPELPALLLLSVFGVATYAAGVWLLWQLDGCKDGPERSIFTRIGPLQAYAERRRSPYDWIAEGQT